MQAHAGPEIDDGVMLAVLTDQHACDLAVLAARREHFAVREAGGRQLAVFPAEMRILARHCVLLRSSAAPVCARRRGEGANGWKIARQAWRRGLGESPKPHRPGA